MAGCPAMRRSHWLAKNRIAGNNPVHQKKGASIRFVEGCQITVTLLQRKMCYAVLQKLGAIYKRLNLLLLRIHSLNLPVIILWPWKATRPPDRMQSEG